MALEAQRPDLFERGVPDLQVSETPGQGLGLGLSQAAGLVFSPQASNVWRLDHSTLNVDHNPNPSPPTPARSMCEMTLVLFELPVAKMVTVVGFILTYTRSVNYQSCMPIECKVRRGTVTGARVGVGVRVGVREQPHPHLLFPEFACPSSARCVKECGWVKSQVQSCVWPLVCVHGLGSYEGLPTLRPPLAPPQTPPFPLFPLRVK